MPLCAGSESHVVLRSLLESVLRSVKMKDKKVEIKRMKVIVIGATFQNKTIGDNAERLLLLLLNIREFSLGKR